MNTTLARPRMYNSPDGDPLPAGCNTAYAAACCSGKGVDGMHMGIVGRSYCGLVPRLCL